MHGAIQRLGIAGDVVLNGNDVRVPQTVSFGDADGGVRWVGMSVW